MGNDGYRSKVLKAALFALDKHQGQLDDNGHDYFLSHLMPVAFATGQLTSDDDVICSAYLHDTLEDTDTTYEELAEKFGKRVADLVHELTHEGSKDEYGFYFPRLQSQDAILIKLIDRASNITRMQSWDNRRKQQYLKKTKFWKTGEDRNDKN
jgi:(p)ppGpp synthase/HD superfamily hydrolase